MDSLDKLHLTIRQTPLLERLTQAQRMIGKMCADGRYPRMSVPAQASDEDVFISLTLGDAAAMIKQLTWEVETICTILDKERKQPNGMER
jgi:hypothetical protein